jgi:TPR repeat protein
MIRFEMKDISRCQEAAEEGRAEAQYNLGLLYSTGQGVPQDYVLAHKWFNLAAMAGNTDAREVRRELARDMTAGEIAEAQRLAREWKMGQQGSTMTH